MKIYRLTSSYHLHEIIEDTDYQIDEFHTDVELPENLENPRFINGEWIDDIDKDQSIKLSAYSFYRKTEYPPIEDFADAWVKNDEQALEEYRQKCLAVKAKYPKN